MIKRYALGLAAALAVSASPAAAATIINGGFEIGTDPGTFATILDGDSTSIFGWTVGTPIGEPANSGSVDYIGTYWDGAGAGLDRSIDLAGNSLGTIYQDIATVAGQMYEVTFYASKNPDGGDTVRTGTISADGSSGTFQYSTFNSLANMQWELRTFTFIATDVLTRLTFSADTSAGCCYGPALDSVTIAAVPEPEVWALLLLGFGVIGLQMRRRSGLRAVTA